MELAEPHALAWIGVHLAVFCAAALQAVVGIGFGLVAGPVLMLAIGDASAVQVSVILSFLVAAALARSVLRLADRPVLRDLLAGAALGVLAGAAAYRLLDFAALKTLAGAVVLAMLALTFGRARREGAAGRPARLAAGAASGVLTALLAMPGPPIAACLLAARLEMARIRATTLATFLFAFPAAFLAQVAAAGAGAGTFAAAAMLAPATLLGVLCGARLVRVLPERLLRQVVRFVLLACGAALLA